MIDSHTYMRYCTFFFLFFFIESAVCACGIIIGSLMTSQQRRGKQIYHCRSLKNDPISYHQNNNNGCSYVPIEGKVNHQTISSFKFAILKRIVQPPVAGKQHGNMQVMLTNRWSCLTESSHQSYHEKKFI